MNDCMRLEFGRVVGGHVLEMAKLFTAISNLEQTGWFAKEYGYDTATRGMIDVLESGAGRKWSWVMTDTDKDVSDVNATDSVVVCYSGGKDSTATAIRMRERGYDVRLFYVSGINKSYPDELEHARTLAALLDMPLHVEYVRQRGRTTFKESPVKNQVIASMALDYAVREHIGTTVAFGDFTTDVMANSAFTESWSDTQEMWDAWLTFVRTYVPAATLLIPFATYNETLDVVSDHPDILKAVCGCILPYRFRKVTRDGNEKKYGISLLPNRCGSCWKCCTEYIFLAEKGVLPMDKAFYDHCIDFLVGKLPSVHPEIKTLNRENAYRAFLHKEPR